MRRWIRYSLSRQLRIALGGKYLIIISRMTEDLYIFTQNVQELSIFLINYKGKTKNCLHKLNDNYQVCYILLGLFKILIKILKTPLGKK